MSEFKTFSDVARLYAENSALVDLMYEKMMSEVASFLKAVAEAVQERVGTEVQVKETKTGWWYYWLPTSGVPPDASFQLTCRMTDPGIVLGRVVFSAGAPQADAATLKRLARAAHAPEIRSFCTPGGGGAWSLFTAAVEYGSQMPVAEAADRIAKVLLAAKAEYERAD